MCDKLHLCCSCERNAKLSAKWPPPSLTLHPDVGKVPSPGQRAKQNQVSGGGEQKKADGRKTKRRSLTWKESRNVIHSSLHILPTKAVATMEKVRHTRIPICQPGNMSHLHTGFRTIRQKYNLIHNNVERLPCDSSVNGVSGPLTADTQPTAADTHMKSEGLWCRH